MKKRAKHDAPVHLAVIRRARLGREAEFQEALREFFQASFNDPSVLGANMLVPVPGSGSREFGILRTFRNAKDRDAFYESPMFKEFEKNSSHLYEGEPVFRELDGLEAWFRSPNPPPRWKMALVTLLGVFPTHLLLALTIGKAAQVWPAAARALILSICMVTILTWVVMPLLTRLLRRWL